MIEACKNYGVPEPVFTETGSDFRVEFFRDTDAGATVNATVNLDSSIFEKYPELQIMIDEPDITMSQLAERLNCNRATVYRHINKLKEMNIVTRTGSDKSGTWVVKIQGKK